MPKLVKVNTKRTSPYATITDLGELFKPKRRLLESTTIDFFPISIWVNIASNLNQVRDLVNLAKTCKSTYKATKPILIRKSCYDFTVTEISKYISQDQGEKLTVQIHAGFIIVLNFLIIFLVIPGDETRTKGMIIVTVDGENIHPKAAHTLDSIRLSEMKIREVLVTSSSWIDSEKCSICYFDGQGHASKIHLKSGTELAKDFDLEPAELLTSSNQPSEIVEKTIDAATVYYSLYYPYKASLNVLDVAGSDSMTYRHEESYILTMRYLKNYKDFILKHFKSGSYSQRSSKWWSCSKKGIGGDATMAYRKIFDSYNRGFGFVLNLLCNFHDKRNRNIKLYSSLSRLSTFVVAIFNEVFL